MSPRLSLVDPEHAGLLLQEKPPSAINASRKEEINSTHLQEKELK